MNKFLLIGMIILNSSLYSHVVPAKNKGNYSKLYPYVVSWEKDLYHLQGSHTVLKSATPFTCKNGKKGFLITDYQNNFLRHVENNYSQVSSGFYKNDYVSPVREYCTR